MTGTSARLDELTSGGTEGVIRFATLTIAGMMRNGALTKANCGVELQVTRPGSRDFNDADVITFGQYVGPDPASSRGAVERCIVNAHGMNRICQILGMDSHEAIVTYEGALADYDDICPFGGAVIDQRYGICVAVYGFTELENLLLARAIRNFIVSHLDGPAKDFLRRRREQILREDAEG